MIQADKRYVHGTAAPKIQYDVYEENKVLKQKKAYRVNKRVKLKAVFTILLVFSLCFTLTYRYALLTEMNYKISKTNRQYNELRDENARLKVDIEKSIDLVKIKELAETRLGMQKPDRNQVVYVRVPKNDFTIVTEEYKNTEKTGEGTLSSLVSGMSKFVSLLH